MKTTPIYAAHKLPINGPTPLPSRKVIAFFAFIFGASVYALAIHLLSK